MRMSLYFEAPSSPPSGSLGMGSYVPASSHFHSSLISFRVLLPPTSSVCSPLRRDHVRADDPPRTRVLFSEGCVHGDTIELASNERKRTQDFERFAVPGGSVARPPESVRQFRHRQGKLGSLLEQHCIESSRDAGQSDVYLACATTTL